MLRCDTATHLPVERSPRPGLLTRLWCGIATWYRIRRELDHQRVTVSRMSARDAADIGMTREQLAFELERPAARAFRWL